MKLIRITLVLAIFLGCTQENLQPQSAAASSSQETACSSNESEAWIKDFHEAIEHNNLRIAKGILEQCSKRQLQTVLNEPFWSTVLNRTAYPLHVASDRGYYDLVSLLLDKGANPDVRTTKSRFTPLHLAVRSNRFKIVKLLLTEEAKNVTYLDHEAGTKPTPIKVVKSVPTNVNAQDVNGFTPLHWAAKEGYEKIAALLLSNPRTDRTIIDEHGKTAGQLAQAYHNPHIEKLFNDPAEPNEAAPGCCYRVCSKIKKVRLNLCGGEVEVERRD